MAKSQALIIGDVHGILKRLESLLIQEGIIGPCQICAATGDVSDGTREAEFCPHCKGNGLARIDYETEVIQLGDLMDMMPERTSPTADDTISTFADDWVDTFLWGNHERPIVGGPTFSGFYDLSPEIRKRLDKWQSEGRMKLAHHFDKFLITHAGLSAKAFTGHWVDDHGWYPERTGSLNRYSPQRLANWINRKDLEREYVRKMYGGFGWDLRDNVGYGRGGDSPWGGIIWRDSWESLWAIPQIFGHTSHKLPLTIEHDGLTSYCIDTSKHGSLSAIWLSGEEEPRLVTVYDDDEIEAWAAV